MQKTRGEEGERRADISKPPVDFDVADCRPRVTHRAGGRWARPYPPPAPLGPGRGHIIFCKSLEPRIIFVIVKKKVLFKKD